MGFRYFKYTKVQTKIKKWRQDNIIKQTVKHLDKSSTTCPGSGLSEQAPLWQLRHCTGLSESTSAKLFPNTLPGQCSTSGYRHALWLHSQGGNYEPLSSKAEQTGLPAAGTQQQTTPYTIRGNNKLSSREGLHEPPSRSNRPEGPVLFTYPELNRGEE